MRPNDPLEPLAPHDDEERGRSNWIWIVVTIAVTALVVLYLLIRTNAIQEGGIIEGRMQPPQMPSLMTRAGHNQKAAEITVVESPPHDHS